VDTVPDDIVEVWRSELRDDLAASGERAGWDIPDAVGGPSSLVALAVLAEEVGRAVAPGLLQTTFVRGAGVLGALGQVELARAAAAGELTVAWCDGGTVTARLDGAGWSLSGTVPLVAHARVVEALVVQAHVHGGDGVHRGDGVFMVRAAGSGVTATPARTLATDAPCDVVFDGAIVPLELRLDDSADPEGTAAGLELARDRAVLGLCAELVGVAASALDLAVARVSAREQYGAPIGTLQAVQHRCADLHVDVTAMRLAVLDAAQRAGLGLPWTREAAMAAVTCADGALRVTAGAQHLHGGEGFYADQPIGARYLRARALVPRLGPIAGHLHRVLTG
jgi:alkylation response protein AidB-like acyl-CoA dehydrogenase